MSDMRNQLTHAYDVTDYEIVRDTLQHDFPDVHRRIRAMLGYVDYPTEPTGGSAPRSGANPSPVTPKLEVAQADPAGTRMSSVSTQTAARQPLRLRIDSLVEEIWRDFGPFGSVYPDR